MSHIKSQHPEYNKSQQSSVSTFFQAGPSVTRTGHNNFGWIDWICMDLLPFSIVEKESTRKCSNLGSISRNTLIKYMEKLTKCVENEIAKELTDKFSLIIDGWTSGSTHFVGLFASYPSQRGYSTVLLAFSPLQSEISFTAQDHFEFIEYVLGIYGMSVDILVAISGDNAEINKCLANPLNVPLIGCSSHKLNLAVSKYLDRKNEILWKIHGIMTKLRTPKLAGELRQFTALQSDVRNKTRWLSTMNMVARYLEIKGFVEQLPSCSKLVDYIPTAKVNQELSFQRNFSKTTFGYKSTSARKYLLCDARVLFEEVLKLYKEEEFREYLSTRAVLSTCLFLRVLLSKCSNMMKNRYPRRKKQL